MAAFCHRIIKLINRNNNAGFVTFFQTNSSKCTFLRVAYSTQYPTQIYDDRDPAPIFFSNDVQSSLKILTRVDLNKVYRKRRTEAKYLDPPEYKFMTSKQLEEAMVVAEQEAERKLQMPPVVKVRTPINTILHKDPALQGLETVKLVFTDITYGVSDSQRLIVARQPDGTLEHADWQTRHRMNQLYFPKIGRKLTIPRMFEDEYLKNVLERFEYEFVLDRACIQFEPNDEQYQRVTALTYEHINNNNHFDTLRSTRHFGPLVFYLTWTTNIDNLLTDLIEHAQIVEACHLVQVFYKIHNSLKPSEELSELGLIEHFITNEASKKAQLELALQGFKDYCRQNDGESRNIATS